MSRNHNPHKLKYSQELKARFVKRRKDALEAKRNNPNITREERMMQRAMKRRLEKKYRKYVNNNREWSLLQEKYESVKRLFNPIFVLLEKCNEFKPTQYLSQAQKIVFYDLINFLKLDTIAFKEDLEMIYNIHKEKTGYCSLEDWEIMIAVGEKYFLFQEFFTAIIPPVFDHIIDLIRLAEENKAFLEQKKIDENKDNVVSIDAEEPQEDHMTIEETTHE